MSDDEEDPFERLEDEVPDREGDPFTSLADERADAESGDTGQAEESDWVDEFGVADPDQTGGSTDQGDENSGTEEVSWEDEGRSRRSLGPDDRETDIFEDVGHREGDPFEEGGLFEERDTEGVDPETVWEDLAASDDEQETETVEGRRFAEVSKHSYCEQCEYFSGPPEIACNHEGTNIVEFLDMETVRLVDCPVVAERLELEEE